MRRVPDPRPHQSHLRHLRLVLVPLLLIAAPGCYRHVVGTRGFGAADSMRVRDPNAPAEKSAKQRKLPADRRDVSR